jgi:DNA-directed RNA polymerase specialized sigma24 family protein
VDPHQTASRFHTTSWTLVVSARSNPEDLETLLGAYWSPVYAYLRRKGKSREDAADITQAFLADVLLNRDLIGKADRDRGRFRAFLLAALERFVIDAYRREHGRKGQRAPAVVPKDSALLEAAEPSDTDDPARAFYRQWATTALEITLGRLEEACTSDGLDRHWRVFEQRVVRPACDGCEPAAIARLVEEVGARDGPEISSMVNTVKRKFRVMLRDVVADTLDDPGELDGELADLRAFLAP